MDSLIVLWNEWRKQVGEIFAELHQYQQTSLAFFVQGIVLSGSAVSARVAEKLRTEGLSEAKVPSIEKRLVRFLSNERLPISSLWCLFLHHVLSYWKHRSCFVILDATPYRTDATILYIGLLVHSRVLPLAWAVLPGQEKWEEGQWEVVDRLMGQIADTLPGKDWTLLADRGLTGHTLVDLCRKYHWHFVLRIGANHTCQRVMKGKRTMWLRVDLWVQAPGRSWYGKAFVWQDNTLETFVSALWAPGYKEPWILISDRPAGKQRITDYAKRMRVESTFQDSKSRGWDLEMSGVTRLDRIERLLFVVFLAMWWVGYLAASCIHGGHRSLFDRADRRDKGIFRLGRFWLAELLKIARSSPTQLVSLIKSCLPFHKRQGQWAFSLRF